MKQYLKKYRKLVKQEKRIIKLLYQKWLMHDFNLDKNTLYLEFYKPDRSKFGYIPEIHYDEKYTRGHASQFLYADCPCYGGKCTAVDSARRGTHKADS